MKPVAVKRFFLILVALITTVIFSAPNISHAVTFATGDLFAGTNNGTVLQIREVGGVLTVVDTLNGSGTSSETGMAFDSAGNLYVTNFANSNITRFDTDGNVIAPDPFVSGDSGAHNESIVFDAAGNFYVGQPDGTSDILKFAADGTFLARYNVAADLRGSDWIDLAADQHTMYYTSEGRAIQRYDVATDTQLTNFAVLPGTSTTDHAYALRLLTGGGLIVADDSNVKRLDSTGTVVQTYDIGSQSGVWFALNLDPDGTSFWSATTAGQIRRFDIASGALLDSFDAGEAVFGLALVGERTAALPTPEPFTTTMLLLAGGYIGLMGFNRRRRRP